MTFSVKTVILFVLAFGTVGGVAIWQSMAAPASGKGGHSVAAISFNPTTVSVGQQYTVNGTGFKPNTWETVGAHFPDTTYWNSAISDGQGNISLTFTASSPGNVYHEAKQLGNNARLTLMATGYLMVSP